MSDFSAFSERVIKVTRNGETRRGKLAIATGVNAADVFATIQAIVSSLFDLPADQIWLGYADEEGDVCTLSEHSVSDLACLMPEGAIRLMLKLRTCVASAGKSVDVVQSNAGKGETFANCSHEQGVDDVVHARLQQFVEKFPAQLLPLALAWVQNMDPASIHGFLGMALSSHESNTGPDASCGMLGRQPHDERTIMDMRALHAMEPSALKALLIEVLNERVASGSSASSDPAAPNMSQTCQQPENPLEGIAGALLGGKGKGKGGYSNPDANNDASPNPLGQLLGSLLANKGIGKGCNPQAEASPQAPDWQSLLGNIFAAKGGGKGGSSAQPSQPDNGPSATSEAVNESRSAFEESVADLVNMGLVADLQTARELLTRHGDISSVVAAMSED